MAKKIQTLRDINENNKDFWDKHQKKIDKILKKPSIVEKAVSEVTNSIIAARGNPHAIQSLDKALLDENLKAIGQAHVEAQSKRAKGRRGKIDSGSQHETQLTVSELIEKIASRSEYYDWETPDICKDAWRHLWSALDERGLDPKETRYRGDTEKDTYEYDFPNQSGRKTISYAAFCTAVRNARRA